MAHPPTHPPTQHPPTQGRGRGGAYVACALVECTRLALVVSGRSTKNTWRVLSSAAGSALHRAVVPLPADVRSTPCRHLRVGTSVVWRAMPEPCIVYELGPRGAAVDTLWQWRDAMHREGMRAMLERESDLDRRRPGRVVRGHTTRRRDDPSQTACNHNSFQDVPWQTVAQNKGERSALEQTSVQSRIRSRTRVQVPHGRWMRRSPSPLMFAISIVFDVGIVATRSHHPCRMLHISTPPSRAKRHKVGWRPLATHMRVRSASRSIRVGRGMEEGKHSTRTQEGGPACPRSHVSKALFGGGAPSNSHTAQPVRVASPPAKSLAPLGSRRMLRFAFVDLAAEWEAWPARASTFEATADE